MGRRVVAAAAALIVRKLATRRLGVRNVVVRNLGVRNLAVRHLGVRNVAALGVALLGLAALGVAFAGPLATATAVLAPSTAAPPASSSAAPPASSGVQRQGRVELAARFGRLSPPSQSTGLAVAADGSLAVVDRGREVIIRLDAAGRPLTEWGPRFGPDLTASDLVGIAADGDGWYVLDRGAPSGGPGGGGPGRGGPRILRLDAQGQALPDRTIDLAPLATYGPNGLARAPDGSLLLADTGRDRVLVFQPGGALVGTVGESGADLGKLKQPLFLAFAPDGALFVSDWENARVVRFGPDRRATSAWSVPGHPWGIAVDQMGRVFVPDPDANVVRIFGPEGSVLATIGGNDAPPLPLDAASQVAVSPDGQVLWVLGTSGLARVDLTPYANLRPGTVPQPANVPLAAMGGALLLASTGVVIFGARGRAPGGLTRPEAAATAVAEPVPAPEPEPVTAAAVRPPPSPALGARGRAVAAGGLALVAAGAIAASIAEILITTDPTIRTNPWPRMALLGAAGLVFGVGCWRSARAWPWCRVVDCWPSCASSVSCIGVVPSTVGQRASRRASRERHADVTIWAFCAIVATLAAVAGVTWSQGRFQTPEATRGALIWLAAIAVTVGGLLAVPALRDRWRFPRPGRTAVVCLALFVLALAPRAWNNADLPYGVWFDEAEAGLQARRFLESELYTPITDTYGRDASLFYYGIALAQRLIGNPVEAGRLVSAIVGAACAPLMFLLGRELFGWPVGVLAGALLAASRWHLDVSRLGWDPISLPLCALLAFWLLARTVRTARWTDAIWAGLAIGVGMHAYIGFRALPLLALLLLVYGGLRQRWAPAELVGRVGATAAAAALVALPVIIFAVQDPAAFNGRLNQTLILNEPVPQTQKIDELWSNLQKHVLMFHVSGDMNGRHNLPGAPMLDPLSGALMVLGLGVLVARPFDWRSLLLVGWALVSLAGGILTFPFEAPQAMRTLGITPVLALLVALGLGLLLDRAVLLIRRPRPRAGLVAVAGGAALVWIGFTNLDTFFRRQMNDPTVWESFSTRETIPARAMLEAPQPYEAILGSPTIAPSLQAQLLVPTLTASIRTFDPSADLPYRGNGPGLIVLETEHDAGVADEVARYYPDAVRRPIVAPNGSRPLVDEVQLDPNVISGHRGLAAARRGQGRWVADLFVDVPGIYALRPPPGFAMSVDDRAIASEQRFELARGNHRLGIVAASGGDLAPRVEWQTPGSDVWRSIDDRLLFAAPDGGNGLEVTFYPSTDWQGSPTETLIDPILAHYYHLNPFARLNRSPSSWSAEWRGFVDVPASGIYRFDVDRLGRAGLWIDERAVFDDTASDSPSTQSGLMELTSGRHAIRVRLQVRGEGGPRLYLYWTRPGAGRELVPGRVLYPPPPRQAQ